MEQQVQVSEKISLHPGCSEDALVRKQPKDGTERLRPHQVQKGQVLNPTGANQYSKRPITDRLGMAVEIVLPNDHRYIQEIRAILGEGVKLPKKMTLADVLAMKMVLAVMGQVPGFKLDIMREIRLALEGRESLRIEIPPEAEHEPTHEELVDRIMAHMIGVIRERKEIFGLELPNFTSMEQEAEEVAKQEAKGQAG